MSSLCDVNIWLALALSGHAHHRLARDWLASVEESTSIAFCRATQQALLRLLTNAAVLEPFGSPPLTNTQAWAGYAAFAADDRVFLRADEPRGLEDRWRALAERDTASPKLWMDAYLAAFALTAGYTLVTNDRAFRQFPDLDLRVIEGPAATGGATPSRRRREPRS